jgi:hypothetical protein
MITFAPYVAGDVAAIRMAGEGKIPPSVDDLAQSSWAFTGWIDGRAIAAGGILRRDPWRAVAWAVFAADLPMRAWPHILEKCHQVLNLAHLDGIAAIEAEVAMDFAPGHRFARRLGFSFAGVVPGRFAGGNPARLYVRGETVWERVPLRVRALLDLTERTLDHALELQRAA